MTVVDALSFVFRYSFSGIRLTKPQPETILGSQSSGYMLGSVVILTTKYSKPVENLRKGKYHDRLCLTTKCRKKRLSFRFYQLSGDNKALSGVFGYLISLRRFDFVLAIRFGLKCWVLYE